MSKDKVDPCQQDEKLEQSALDWIELCGERIVYLPELDLPKEDVGLDDGLICQNPPNGVVVDALVPGKARYAVGYPYRRGGPGVVYKGYDLKMNRPVGVKFLSHMIKDEADYRSMLQNEARTMARLDHPGVAKVYDLTVSETGGVAMVMEWLEEPEWKNLRERLREKPINTADEVLSVIGQLSEIIRYLNSMELSYRDLKPENIMVDQSGRIKLIDFGSAKWTRGVDVDDEVSWITQRYASPELIRGKRVGPESDVYQLGLIAYEILTGRIYAEVLSWPEEYCWGSESGLREDVKVVLKRALALDPQDRYQDTGEFYNALEEAMLETKKGVKN